MADNMSEMAPQDPESDDCESGSGKIDCVKANEMAGISSSKDVISATQLINERDQAVEGVANSIQ